MDIPTIHAWARQERGTRPSRRLRARGLVPVVLYGRDEPNVLLTMQVNAIAQILASHSMILQVEWDGHVTPVQFKEVQFDNLGDAILHADFNRISLTETVQVSVPIEPHGEPVGVREGDGVLELVLHEVEVESLPTGIPEKIRVEVADLKIGDDIRLGSLKLPEGVVVLGDLDAVVLMVAAPTELVEEEAVAPAAEIVAEPEVIGRAQEKEAEGAAEEREATGREG